MTPVAPMRAAATFGVEQLEYWSCFKRGSAWKAVHLYDLAWLRLVRAMPILDAVSRLNKSELRTYVDSARPRAAPRQSTADGRAGGGIIVLHVLGARMLRSRPWVVRGGVIKGGSPFREGYRH